MLSLVYTAALVNAQKWEHLHAIAGVRAHAMLTYLSCVHRAVMCFVCCVLPGVYGVYGAVLRTLRMLMLDIT